MSAKQKMPAILKEKFKWLQTDHRTKAAVPLEHDRFGHLRMLVFCFLVKERRLMNCCRLSFNTNVLFSSCAAGMAPFFVGRGSVRVHFEALTDPNREFVCVGPDASADRQATILACVWSHGSLRELDTRYVNAVSS